MVLIEIDDEVWNKYKKSWAILGVKTDEDLIEMLESQLWEESINCIQAAKEGPISNEPEALVLRAIGLMEEKTKAKPNEDTKPTEDE